MAQGSARHPMRGPMRAFIVIYVVKLPTRGLLARVAESLSGA
jgi:hypothetical protein